MTSSETTASIEHLYSDHHRWLQAWLRRRLSNSSDAADVSQDTWVRLIVSGRLPLPGQARSYLLQIAQGLAIDLKRRRLLEAEYLDALGRQPEGLHGSPEEHALVVEALLLLDQALAALPVKAREVFLMARLEGLTYSQIAQQMRMSVANVRKYMLKAVVACDAAVMAGEAS